MPEEPPRSRRLAPEDRRGQIIETAMRLFGERGYADVSASDIARAAGVTPALVTHYFGPKREIYLAVVDRMRDVVAESDPVSRGLPIEERLRHDLDGWLDWVDANRELWLATAGLGDVIADEDILTIVTTAREEAATRILADYADVVEDTPEARFALQSWMGLNQAALRRWLRGDATRQQTHDLLALSLLAMLRDVIPALARESR